MRASRRCYAPALRTEARFPGLAAGAGHYESFFLRANRPSGGESVWIRYTIDRPPGADATASLWLTWFDAASPAPLAAKASFPPRLVFPPGGYIAIGEASLTPGHATGSIAREGGELGWDLRFDDGANAFDHLSRGWMYSGSFPRTKVRSPYPSSRFSGVLRLGDRTVEIDGWPGHGRAQLGQPSTPSGGSGSMPRGSTAAPGSSTWSRVGCASPAACCRGSPTGSSSSRASGTGSAGSAAIPSFHLQEDATGATFKVAGGGIVVHGRVEARERARSRPGATTIRRAVPTRSATAASRTSSSPPSRRARRRASRSPGRPPTSWGASRPSEGQEARS